jgi:AAA domain-containing protein
MADDKRSRLVRTERDEMSVSDFAAEIFDLGTSAESFNLLIYGDSNIGKTHLAATAPGKMFWLVCEPGYKTAERMGATGKGRRIADTASAWAAVEWLEFKNRASKYDWLILDGLSTMQDRFRLSYTAEAFDASGGTKRAHRNLPDKPDYFNTQNFLRAWVARLVDLPVNVIITAHKWFDDDTDTVFPGIQGKGTEVANTISGLMDATGLLQWITVKAKGGKETRRIRRLYFEPPPARKKGEDLQYIVGEKLGIGSHVDNPTVEKLLSRIASSREENGSA